MAKSQKKPVAPPDEDARPAEAGEGNGPEEEEPDPAIEPPRYEYVTEGYTPPKRKDAEE